MIRAAIFDFGETLLSEERAWGMWAEWLGVPKQELFAALGWVIATRRPHAEALALVSPGFELQRALAERERAGVPRHEELYDLYPDVPGAVDRLRRGGIAVGAAGNQPAGAGASLGDLFHPGELVATSAGWGLWKPDPEFFARIAEELGMPPGEVAYVGDRVDFDVLPAAEAGMFTVHLRRGPWGVIHATWDEVWTADVAAANLDEAVDAILTSGG